MKCAISSIRIFHDFGDFGKRLLATRCPAVKFDTGNLETSQWSRGVGKTIFCLLLEHLITPPNTNHYLFSAILNKNDCQGNDMISERFSLTKINENIFESHFDPQDMYSMRAY